MSKNSESNDMCNERVKLLEQLPTPLLLGVDKQKKKNYKTKRKRSAGEKYYTGHFPSNPSTN